MAMLHGDGDGRTGRCGGVMFGIIIMHGYDRDEQVE